MSMYAASFDLDGLPNVYRVEGVIIISLVVVLNIIGTKIRLFLQSKIICK